MKSLVEIGPSGLRVVLYVFVYFRYFASRPIYEKMK